MIRKYSLLGVFALSLLLMSCSQSVPTTLVENSTPDQSVDPKSPTYSPSQVIASASVSQSTIKYDYGILIGQIVDDRGNHLDGVTLKAISLNSALPFESTTISKAGSYIFKELPNGVIIEVTATKPGYKTKKRRIVLLACCIGLNATNEMNFGVDYNGNIDLNYALVLESPAITPNNDDCGSEIIGTILDDNGNKLNGVTLKAVSLNSARPYESVTTNIDGLYKFTEVPIGVTIMVTATKFGYTSRVMNLVVIDSRFMTSGLLCSKNVASGNFGLDSNGKLEPSSALSDKPEVTSITPNFDSSEINPATSFILTFSEPMDKNSVETNLVIRNRDDYIFTNKSSYGGRFKDIYDISHYDASWNSANDEVTFTPKKGTSLPTDTDSAKIPGYYVTFRDVVKDSTGVQSRTLNNQADGITPFDIYKGDGPFRVTSVFKTGSPFAIATDTTAPRIEKVDIIDATSIKLQFSENMALYPLSFFKPFYDPNLTDPKFYTIKVDKNGDNSYSQDEIIGNPIAVVLDINEVNSVKLSLPSLINYKGKKLWVGISDGVNLSDPAGNAISNDKDRYSATE